MPSKTVDKKKILIIAGYDPSGGAGILADVKTIHMLGSYAIPIPSCFTVQDTKRVYKVKDLELEIFKETLEKIIEDFYPIDGVKIGVLFSKEIIKIVKKFIKDFRLKNIVLDPVINPTYGVSLIKDDAIEELIDLISYCDVLTPNIKEAEFLSKISIKNVEDMKKSAYILKTNLKLKNIIIKGGDMENCDKIHDLFYDGINMFLYQKEKIKRDIHGTGCVFSSIITHFLSKKYSPFYAFYFAEYIMEKMIMSSIKIGRGRHVIDI